MPRRDPLLHPAEVRCRQKLELGQCPCDGSLLGHPGERSFRHCHVCTCLWKLDADGRAAVARAEPCPYGKLPSQ